MLNWNIKSLHRTKENWAWLNEWISSQPILAKTPHPRTKDKGLVNKTTPSKDKGYAIKTTPSKDKEINVTKSTPSKDKPDAHPSSLLDSR